MPKIHIKNFKLESDHEAWIASDDFKLHYVSLVQETKNVHYDPKIVPPAEDVLIGGVRWATKNIGAVDEYDQGYYFQYGKGANQYAATSGDPIYEGQEDPLDYSVDSARQILGGTWRTPTVEDFENLLSATTQQVGGTSPYIKFIDKTDPNNYLILPFAGEYVDGELIGGYFYWTSSPSAMDADMAYRYNYINGESSCATAQRNIGLVIRPVRDA